MSMIQEWFLFVLTMAGMIVVLSIGVVVLFALLRQKGREKK
jgi:hypothetical protein